MKREDRLLPPGITYRSLLRGSSRLMHAPQGMVKRLGSYNGVISDTTVDATGAPNPSCVVKLYRTGDDSLVATTTSDGSGNFTFIIGQASGNYYIVAYKLGSPDTFGTTANTLVGA